MVVWVFCVLEVRLSWKSRVQGKKKERKREGGVAEHKDPAFTDLKRRSCAERVRGSRKVGEGSLTRRAEGKSRENDAATPWLANNGQERDEEPQEYACTAGLAVVVLCLAYASGRLLARRDATTRDGQVDSYTLL